MEFSPFVGPDSLRAVTHLMKALFENHTPRYYGHEDIEGSYYEGTVENWGAESLLESHKLLLDKPALKNILIENTFDYYFDIRYSNFVNTYDQQNMLCALLKKDVLLSNKTYKLKFEDAYDFNVPRSKSDGDSNVVIDNFIMTLTPPTLIEIENDTVIAEHELKLTDKSGVSTVYFFHADVETEEIIDEIISGTMITKPINDSMRGWPMIWMCVDELRTLPDIRFEGNEYGEDSKPFLTIGTNGNDLSFIYPFLSLSTEEIDINKMAIKILPTENGSFDINSPEEATTNYETDISEIHLLVYDEDITDENIYQHIGTRPTVEYVITYDYEMNRITIANSGVNWYYKYPVPGDYDYDGTTYVNRTYAYLPAYIFYGNQTNGSPLPLLALHVYDEYEYPDEYLSTSTYAGIHVDITSDYSDNGVNKKNGVIHNLGDFDGLPPYFKYNLNKILHRAHVEMYALRDRLNLPNQHAMDKPTAAVIVDSAIPQTELQEIDDNLPITIRFDRSDTVERHFRWYDEPVSRYNVLSEITYDDMYHFGNVRMKGQGNKKKLVYHGNRHFSLNRMGFDPDLEYGRVYIISNDSCAYVNNDLTPNAKPLATFARICDIPTNYNQLISVPNRCPTFILDREYVRTETSFDSASVDIILNKTKVDRLIHDHSTYLFDASNVSDVDTVYANEFKHWTNLTPYIHTNNNIMVTWDVITSGAIDYDVDDIFDFNIGGINVKGKVITVDQGVPQSVLFLDETSSTPDDYSATSPKLAYDIISLSNLNGNDTSFDTHAKVGSGQGLVIRLLIDPAYYTGINTCSDGNLTEVFYFFKDEYNKIHIYEKPGSYSEQVTGAVQYRNEYDGGRYGKIDVRDSMMMTYTHNGFKNLGNPETRIDISYNERIRSTDPITGTRDWSPELNEGLNTFQDCYFTITPSTFEHAAITAYSNCNVISTANDFDFPVYGDLNLKRYQMKSNVIKMNTEDQPTLYMYDPNMSKKYEFTDYVKDMVFEDSSRDMDYSDIFGDADIVNSNGKLKLNVYSYNEYNLDEVDLMRRTLETRSREDLINIITDCNPTAFLIKYESDISPYKFTKDMLIDYLIENHLYWGPDEVPYSDCDKTIYRKQGTSLFGTKGSDAPKLSGDYVNITTDVFNPNGKLNTADTTFSPLFVFELDKDIDPTTLDGFRLKDSYGVDISTESIIIINGIKYMAEVNGDNISWVEVYKRRNNV